MNTSIILSILGFAATIIFGFLSIDLFKRKKNPGKLTLVKQTIIGLFNNIAKNFDEISIKYKGEAIKENVIYIKASIINDGDIDIDGNRVEKTLNLNLKSGLKWIKAKVTESTPELICNTSIDQNQADLKFNFGLIKKKEFFQFEALIETDDSKIESEDVYNYITISHRIANTQKVNIVSLLSEEQIKRKKKRIKSSGLSYGGQFLFLILLLLAQVLYFKTAPIYYKTIDNIVYKATANSDNEIELKNILTDDKISIPVSEFQNPNKYMPFIPKQTFWEKIKSATYIIPLLIIFVIALIGLDYWELRKSYKFYNIFKQNGDN
jgi:hypothetical protein